MGQITNYVGVIMLIRPRGAARGGRQGGHAPNRLLSGFFTGKLALLGRSNTVLCTRSVPWASNMPKMRWRPWLRPGPRWGSSQCSPRSPSRLRRGIPSQILTSLAPRFSRLRRSASVPCQCKILAMPLIRPRIIIAVMIRLWLCNAMFYCCSSCQLW